MKKSFFLFIALTLGIGAWAQETQTVNYIDANGEKTVTATVITNETNTLSTGWYVVLGNDVQTGTLTCQGGVHLILADGAKLTATGNNTSSNAAGIQVSGGSNYLIIYGQTNQTGQLIATGGGDIGLATGVGSAGIGGGWHGSGSNITINGGIVTANGGPYAAGIGGGHSGSGSNITINGGIVTANGGQWAAGIGGGNDGGSGSNITINGGIITATGGDCAAGIGGGYEGSGSNITINGGIVAANGGENAAGIGGGLRGSGSNITINGGIVTANGGKNAAGIGGGRLGSSSNIKVNADCHVFADNSTPPTTEIQHGSDDDIASQLNVRYAVIEIDQTILSELRAEAIAAIDEAVEGVANDEILAIAREAKNKIMNANGRTIITGIKDAALAELQIPIKWYNTGKTDALGPLGEEQPGPAVKVTKDDKEVILYLPDKVEYIIRK